LGQSVLDLKQEVSPEAKKKYPMKNSAIPANDEDIGVCFIS
jgi:hypothetical protein